MLWKYLRDLQMFCSGPRTMATVERSSPLVEHGSPSANISPGGAWSKQHGGAQPWGQIPGGKGGDMSTPISKKHEVPPPKKTP